MVLSDSKTIKKVAIVGMGALGLLFGKKLTQNLGKDNVRYVLNKERKKRFEKNEIKINGELVSLGIIEEKTKGDPADLVIFAVKGKDIQSALKSAKNQIGIDTIIISVMNGITSEKIIEKAYPKAKVITSVAEGMDAVKIDNELTYTKPGKIVIGYENENSTNANYAKMLADFFESIKFPYTIEQNIKHRLWSKWMLNVGVNQVVTAEKGTYGTVQKDGLARKRMIKAMREAMKMANYEGVNVSEKDLKYYVKLIGELSPDGMPSMRQDTIAGRKTEVDLFSGTVIDLAEKHEDICPVNTALYKEIRKIESSYNIS
jgi:2-dehydropantoate 2-reductase